MTEKCIIEISISEDHDRELGYELEDVVKNAWGYMVPFFTRRHGVKNGEIKLCDGKVSISWEYIEADDGSEIDLETRSLGEEEYRLWESTDKGDMDE